ncbi:MAG: SMC-Scp complex subunit ScpB [Bdellovibrio sp.]|nr:MAG: SMC-Scp complex subunit ScpB [Bdellovibrio sp.]
MKTFWKKNKNWGYWERNEFMMEVSNKPNEEKNLESSAPIEQEGVEDLQQESIVSFQLKEEFQEEKTNEKLEGKGEQAAEEEVSSSEPKEFLSTDQICGVLEALLFASDRPQSFTLLKQAFRGTTVQSKDIKQALKQLQSQYAEDHRGVVLEEVAGGYQLRTKVDYLKFLRNTIKSRPFRLSGPALEVLAIIAYKQPCIKADVDEVRGVESGHLIRSLMDRGLVQFAGKSDLPGKPMLYATTKKFLEVFGLRNIKELPSLSEIDELLPEGIGEEEKETLGGVAESLSKDFKGSYSEGEEELARITEEIAKVSTSSEFFEEEKKRMKALKDKERAQDIRDALATGEEVSERDRRWLERYEAAQGEESNSPEDSSSSTPPGLPLEKGPQPENEESVTQTPPSVES